MNDHDVLIALVAWDGLTMVILILMAIEVSYLKARVTAGDRTARHAREKAGAE